VLIFLEVFALGRQARLDDFLKITERRAENCYINSFSVRAFIEKSNLYLYIEDLEIRGSPICKERLCLELAFLHTSYLFNIGHKVSKKYTITSWLPLVKPLTKGEKNLKEVLIRLLLRDDNMHLIPLTEFKTIKVECKRPKDLENERRKESRIPVIEIPPPETCKHEWITVQILRNMRGDIVAELQYCKKCGLTRRESIP